MVFSCGSLLSVLSDDRLFNVARFIFGYLIFFSAQLSVQYGNEYFDYDADRMTIPTFFSGGSKVLRNNENLKIFSKWISIVLIIVSIILSVLFVFIFKASVRIIILALFANLLGWFYTAPPLKFSYRGLGEIVIMLIIGIILPIAGSVTVSDSVNKEIIVILTPLLLYTAMLSIAVEIPDYEADRISGKKNLVSVYGRDMGYLLLLALSSAAFVYFIR
jgi:1,4-dihydroxy-2-naphthoate octaprenyltransferase